MAMPRVIPACPGTPVPMLAAMLFEVLFEPEPLFPRDEVVPARLRVSVRLVVVSVLLRIAAGCALSACVASACADACADRISVVLLVVGYGRLQVVWVFQVGRLLLQVLCVLRRSLLDAETRLLLRLCGIGRGLQSIGRGHRQMSGPQHVYAEGHDQNRYDFSRVHDYINVRKALFIIRNPQKS